MYISFLLRFSEKEIYGQLILKEGFGNVLTERSQEETGD